MSDLRTAAQQALEALETRGEHHPRVYAAITALRAALAEHDKKIVWVEERKAHWAEQLQLARETQERERQQREESALAEPVQEPVQEPVTWSGYDLDAMVEAFDRVIEAHFSKAHPFHDPTNMDAKMALRILRGLIPAMKAYTAPPQYNAADECAAAIRARGQI